MVDLKRAEFHKIFLVEFKRDTLIVTPQGDAIGFRSSDVVKEAETLAELPDDPKVQHLVIDLERSSYFGSAIIGALSGVAAKIHDAGGRVAVCNVAPDMESMLQIMKLHIIWQPCDTRKEALKAVRR